MLSVRRISLGGFRLCFLLSLSATWEICVPHGLLMAHRQCWDRQITGDISFFNTYEDFLTSIRFHRDMIWLYWRLWYPLLLLLGLILGLLLQLILILFRNDLVGIKQLRGIFELLGLLWFTFFWTFRAPLALRGLTSAGIRRIFGLHRSIFEFFTGVTSGSKPSAKAELLLLLDQLVDVKTQDFIIILFSK